MKGENISERLEAFAVRALTVARTLPRTLPGRHVAGQLLRCATSPGANYEEARGAESKADFIHKLGIVLKELRESRYWLRIIARGELLPGVRLASILQEAEELAMIIGRSIVTARRRA
ncbi:MAG: four helix bundle protein [Deltaproteobacteria bacterium]|nr:four helix bundle protein [Deltaproteobacteria bacterium]